MLFSSRTVSAATLKSASVSMLPAPSAVSKMKKSLPPRPRSVSAPALPLMILDPALPVIELANSLPNRLIALVPTAELVISCST
jgi:hypothetical protein